MAVLCKVLGRPLRIGMVRHPRQREIESMWRSDRYGIQFRMSRVGRAALSHSTWTLILTTRTGLPTSQGLASLARMTCSPAAAVTRSHPPCAPPAAAAGSTDRAGPSSMRWTPGGRSKCQENPVAGPFAIGRLIGVPELPDAVNTSGRPVGMALNVVVMANAAGNIKTRPSSGCMSPTTAILANCKGTDHGPQ